MAKTKRVIEGSNTITEGIVNTLLNYGYSASRINTQGQWIEDSSYRAGGYWRPSGSRVGFADVVACIQGLAFAFEVKYGRDSQRQEQKDFQSEWEAAGGIYIVIKKWEDFMQWFIENKEKYFSKKWQKLDTTPKQ